MSQKLKKEGKFTYLDIGEGTPIVILHGLMGGLSNFDGVSNFFSEKFSPKPKKILSYWEIHLAVILVCIVLNPFQKK